MLGKGGSAFLDFYLQNSLWINGLIFLYILLLIVSRKTYRQTLDYLCLWAEESLAGKGPQDKYRLAATLRSMHIPWEAAGKIAVFPFIAHPSGLWIYPRTITTLENWISAEVLAEALINKSKKNST